MRHACEPCAAHRETWTGKAGANRIESNGVESNGVESNEWREALVRERSGARARLRVARGSAVLCIRSWISRIDRGRYGTTDSQVQSVVSRLPS